MALAHRWHCSHGARTPRLCRRLREQQGAPHGGMQPDLEEVSSGHVPQPSCARCRRDRLWVLSVDLGKLPEDLWTEESSRDSAVMELKTCPKKTSHTRDRKQGEPLAGAQPPQVCGLLRGEGNGASGVKVPGCRVPAHSTQVQQGSAKLHHKHGSDGAHNVSSG